MGKLSDKEQEFKEFILKENKYSTDCHYMVFWGSNPNTIQPYMKEHKISFKMLERVLNNIEAEKKELRDKLKNANCINIEDLEYEEFDD